MLPSIKCSSEGWEELVYIWQNNPFRYLDISGLAAGDLFSSMDLAALDFAQNYNDDSIRSNREYGTKIYKVFVEGETYYSYMIPNIGIKNLVALPDRAEYVADIHTHGAFDKIGSFQLW